MNQNIQHRHAAKADRAKVITLLNSSHLRTADIKTGKAVDAWLPVNKKYNSTQ